MCVRSDKIAIYCGIWARYHSKHIPKLKVSFLDHNMLILGGRCSPVQYEAAFKCLLLLELLLAPKIAQLSIDNYTKVTVFYLTLDWCSVVVEHQRWAPQRRTWLRRERRVRKERKTLLKETVYTWTQLTQFAHLFQAFHGELIIIHINLVIMLVFTVKTTCGQWSRAHG